MSPGRQRSSSSSTRTWTGQQLKSVLQSSARSSTAGIYDQGAGELDVANAITQQVTGPGTVDLGTFEWPHMPSQRTAKQLTYTNYGKTPVTLTFTADAPRQQRQAVAQGSGPASARAR